MAPLPIRFSVIAFFIPAFFTCNAITDFFISDEQEVEMGDKFKKEILADTKNYPQYKGSSEVINYITAMGQRIVGVQKDRPTLKFTFTVIDDDTMINAFAIPGGHVFVYTGLLNAAKSGAEVAGVMAHEIGHVTMRHGAQQLMKSEAVGVVNQILFGDSSSVAGAVAQVCESLLFLKFSRDDENQADSCSVAYTVLAKYNPYGMIHFFETLKAKYGGGMGPFEVLSTHPNTDDRIKEVKRIIGKTSNAPADDGTWTYPDEFMTIKAKI
jgi:predicted Zn-dependent protease